MQSYGNEGYAGFGMRALARIIDNFLMGVFVFVLFLLFFGLDSNPAMGQAMFSTIMIALILFSLVAISYMAALLYAGFYIILLSFGTFGFFDFGETKYFITKALLFLIISLGTYLTYHILLNMRGGTLGKMAVGIQIRDEDTGELLTFGKSLGRFLSLEIISGLVFGLGFLWAAWDKKHQTWHDKLARTIVFHKSYKPTVGPIFPPTEPIRPPRSPRPDLPAFGEIVFTEGRMNGKHFPLRGSKVVVGRGDSAHIVMIDPDKKVSRDQFEIFRKDTRFFIRNLSLKGNTMLNGRKIEGDLALRENDEIQVIDNKMKIKFFN